MTHTLAKLLAHDHPLFSYNMSQMEKASGDSGVDAKLIADILEHAHGVMRSIGVDPADTSGEELYHALGSVVSAGNLLQLATTDFVLLDLDDGPVSFNLHDVIENAHHQLPYSQRSCAHAQRQLRSEIIRRYAEHDRTDHTLIHHLATQMGMSPESVEHHTVKPDNTAPSLLAIGDVFTDAFIKLNESYAKVIKDDDGTKWLALPYGSKPPYEQVDIIESVGPSPNAAISCARLGLNVSLMAWLGDDVPGKDSLKHLASEGVDTSMMVTENGKKSSYWYVLRYESDRTMLVKSEQYGYEWRDPETAPDWIYLSYIGEDSWPLHEKLVSYLEAHPDTKLVFQPGSFHFEWGTEKLAEIYAKSHLVVMNREEAVQVTGKSYDSLKDLTDALHALGPKVVVITDGPNGSYASHGGSIWNIPNYPDPAPPLDRTGAGDAFASTITAGLALGESIETALSWAPINSMSVVQKLGAQEGLLHLDDVKKFLSDAPDGYVASKL